MDKRDQNNQNRLLISTFIVATAVAIYFSDVILPIKQGSVEFFIVAILFASIIISAGLSFLYILSKGYEFRYRQDDKKNFVDKHNHHLYNWSIKSYPWTVGLLAFVVIYDHFENLPSGGEMWTTILRYLLVCLLLALFSARTILGIYRDVRKKG
jgi:hypothetical protein